MLPQNVQQAIRENFYKGYTYRPDLDILVNNFLEVFCDTLRESAFVRDKYQKALSQANDIETSQYISKLSEIINPKLNFFKSSEGEHDLVARLLWVSAFVVGKAYKETILRTLTLPKKPWWHINWLFGK